MLVALAFLGLIVLVLVALAVGVPNFVLLATAFVLLASVLALILFFRGTQETAEPGNPANIVLPGERPPVETPTPSTRSGRRTVAPYVLWALAALMLALGVCSVGVLSRDDNAGVALPPITAAPATVGLAEANGPVLAPAVTRVRPLPSPMPIPTATPATDPVPDEPKRCPPGHQKQGRC